MEKIISINFQGRVIPIEETAYINLKRYIDSLRSHFAKEESSDEIINDIENRIAELFGDRLKRGAPCIVNGDVNDVINSIGRLEDIEAAEGEETYERPNDRQNERPQPAAAAPGLRGRFYRNEDDKVIAGVCSGIALRTGIDPLIMRLLFVLLFGVLFWVYIILWIIVPSQSLQASITRRLYRNPDDKMIGGVCSGLAAYFNTSSKTIRLIFLIPFIVSLISGGIEALTWSWHWGFAPRIVLGSLGSTLFIGYIILWIAVPYATSAADKLEMRGEKVDLNSIRAATQARGGAPMPAPRSSGLARAIGILFKAFFLFIAGTMAIGLFGVLIGLAFAGTVALPFTDFVLEGWTQHTLAWVGISLMLAVPLIALITWIVRRLSGVHSRRHYLVYIFAGLWFTGLICTLTLAGMVSRNFTMKSVQEHAVAITQPSTGKLYIDVSDHLQHGITQHHKWIDWDWDDEDGPFHILHNDSLWLNTVKVKVTQSDDSLFHIYKMNMSRGNTMEQATAMAEHINFNISQQDSIVTLPRGFYISKKDKFRNQQVVVVVEVPVGKAITVDKRVHEYDWFTVEVNEHRRHRHSRRYRHGNWHYSYRSDKDGDYIMTSTGLKNAMDTNEEIDRDDNDYTGMDN